jgi:hypothetical protein
MTIRLNEFILTMLGSMIHLVSTIADSNRLFMPHRQNFIILYPSSSLAQQVDGIIFFTVLCFPSVFSLRSSAYPSPRAP